METARRSISNPANPLLFFLVSPARGKPRRVKTACKRRTKLLVCAAWPPWKKSASSVKTSWKTDVAVERKKRQIQNAQIGTQAARAAKTPRVLIRCRLAWEAGRIELARSGAANRRTRAGAGAFCVSAVMLVFGQAGLRVARPPAAGRRQHAARQLPRR